MISQYMWHLGIVGFVTYTATEGAVLTPGVNCPKVGVSDDGMTLPKSFKFSKDVIVHTSDPVEAL